MFELSVKSRFSAAHHLVDYQGTCAKLHGHNWEIEVVVQGRELDATGILVDFRELKAAVAVVMKEIDHSDLNALDAFRNTNPTSENIARFLYGRFAQTLDGKRYQVQRVCVNETPESRAVYWEDDRKQGGTPGCA
jgi:6-pyruvoyltetrahydropterin/6-carboxytetrahydropterin synthase